MKFGAITGNWNYLIGGWSLRERSVLNLELRMFKANIYLYSLNYSHSCKVVVVLDNVYFSPYRLFVPFARKFPRRLARFHPPEK